jgi:hypothetical protein
MTKKSIMKSLDKILDINNLTVVYQNHYQGTNEEQTCTSEYWIEDRDVELPAFSYHVYPSIWYIFSKEELIEIWNRFSSNQFSLLMELRIDTFGDNADVERWDIISL